ncbi:PAS domain S-box protein [Rubrivirga sp.]|uniref:PAS domain S-box protein n=1 Tax=Rubrivirga sp. TaxID=1885344 RepID=UPI003C729329
MALPNSSTRITILGLLVVTAVAVLAVELHVFSMGQGATSPEDAVIEAVGVGVGLWAVLVVVVALLAYVLGPRRSQRVRAEAKVIADSPTPLQHISRRRADLGQDLDALLPLVAQLDLKNRESRELRGHVAALYQISPHPLVLAELGGALVEGNPAFYALTGLSPQDVRGVDVAGIERTLPVSELEVYAARSLKENSSITGLEADVVDRDGQRRPVEVALRAFKSGGRAIVLYQLTDKLHERQLEHRVASFADTLDLMVDHRVQQLTSGRQALGDALEGAGVAIAAFGSAGNAYRWNRTLEVLTGRRSHSVRDFGGALDALRLAGAEATAFTQWFWSTSDDPYVMVHATPSGPASMMWRRGHSRTPGSADRLTLIGVAMPGLADTTPIGDGHRTARPAAPHAAQR